MVVSHDTVAKPSVRVSYVLISKRSKQGRATSIHYKYSAVFRTTQSLQPLALATHYLTCAPASTMTSCAGSALKKAAKSATVFI